jgi:hypothetical protein
LAWDFANRFEPSQAIADSYYAVCVDRRLGSADLQSIAFHLCYLKKKKEKKTEDGSEFVLGFQSLLTGTKAFGLIPGTRN